MIVEDTVSSSVIVMFAGLTVLNPGAVPLIVIVSEAPSSMESCSGSILSPVAVPLVDPARIVTDVGSPVAV